MSPDRPQGSDRTWTLSGFLWGTWQKQQDIHPHTQQVIALPWTWRMLSGGSDSERHRWRERERERQREKDREGARELKKESCTDTGAQTGLLYNELLYTFFIVWQKQPEMKQTPWTCRALFGGSGEGTA